MRTGVTASGFAWQLDDAVLNNMELVDALAEMQEENPLQISAVCRLVLGKAQRKALYDHLRTEDGRVPASAVESAIMELFQSINAGKNSASSPN